MTTPYYPSRWLISEPDRNDAANVFPYAPGRKFLQRKTPQWSTDVKTSVSGKERRRALWSYPIWRFSVAYEVLRDEPATPDLDRLYAFFNAMQGQAGEFLFWDRGDHDVADALFGIGDGTTADWQLTRTIRVGGISCTEPVLAVHGTPTVTVDGVETAVTLLDRGKVRFASAPADGAELRWSGRFYYVCRFEADEMDVSQLMHGLWEGQSIDFHTVKR